MNIDYYWEKDGLYIVCSGTLPQARLMEEVRSASSDTRFDSARYLIVDLSKTGKVERSLEDIEQVTHYAQALMKTNPNIVHAIVLSQSDEARQALGAYYASLLKDLSWQVDAFLTAEEAVKWVSETTGCELGIPAAKS